jgi:hypothetical protein
MVVDQILTHAIQVIFVWTDQVRQGTTHAEGHPGSTCTGVIPIGRLVAMSGAVIIFNPMLSGSLVWPMKAIC